MWEGQRSEQNRIYDAEHGRTCADADGEGEDGDNRETGILAQHAKSETQILREMFEPRPAPRIVACLAQRESVAEILPCGHVRLLTRETVLDVFFFAQFEMNAHLVVHVVVELLAAKQHPQAAGEFSE